MRANAPAFAPIQDKALWHGTKGPAGDTTSTDRRFCVKQKKKKPINNTALGAKHDSDHSENKRDLDGDLHLHMHTF